MRQRIVLTLPGLLAWVIVAAASAPVAHADDEMGVARAGKYYLSSA
jgi:hypothetical protein